MTRSLADWVVLDVPSGLGLRPPAPGRTPGTAGAPAALRRAGLHARLADQGAELDPEPIVPGPYAAEVAPGRLRNEDAIVEHARRLADRITGVLDSARRPLVLGGDCGLLVGAGLALARRPERVGLVHLDGHTDFRHPGNSDDCASLAGEDLAAAIGRHWPAIADIDGLGPYFDPGATAHAGCREDDTELAEVRAALAATLTSAEVRREGASAAAARLRDAVAGPAGYWVHLDVDVLDPRLLSAVDSPDPGGLEVDELVELLAGLLPGALGLQVTVFDPELDEDGSQARMLAALIARALAAGATGATGSAGSAGAAGSAATLAG